MPRVTTTITTDTASNTTVSLQAFLAFEQSSVERHEFSEGQVFVMAGTSDVHNALMLRLAARFLTLEDQGFRVYTSDVKLQAGESVYYPDIMVMQGNHPQDTSYLKHDAIVVVEVLSPSTEDVDRGEKWLNYQKLPSISAYILLAQDKPRAEVFIREQNNTWSYSVIAGYEAILNLERLGSAIPTFFVPLAALYRR
jgi:Uma2 family endonuclease